MKFTLSLSFATPIIASGTRDSGVATAKVSRSFNLICARVTTMTGSALSITFSPMVPLNDRLWLFGRLVDHEWADDNDKCNTDTRDLERWFEWLRSLDDMVRTIDHIWSIAEARM